MLIVGVRTSKTGRVFLLQNWWKDRYFVVSQEYLVSAKASISFLDPKVDTIPIEFPQIDAGYTETQGDYRESFAAEF